MSLVITLTLLLAQPAAEPPPASGLDIFLQQAAPVLEGARASSTDNAAKSPVEPIVLTVQDAVQRAVLDNPRGHSAEEELAAAEARIAQARAARRPQISTQASYNYITGLDVEIGGPLGSLISGLSDIAPEKDNISVQIGIEQVLYAGGKIKAATEAARHGASATEAELEATLLTLEFETKQSFYDALLAQALTEVAMDSIATFSRHLADVQRMLDVGMVSGFESLRAETELAAREAGSVSATTGADVALLNLKRITGLYQDMPILIEGGLAWQPLNEPVEALVSEALANRPELRGLEEGIAAAEANVKVAKSEFRPQAGLSATYQHVEGGGQLNPQGAVFNVGAQWDIYAGGRRKAAVAEAEAQVRSLDHQYAELEDLVELDVRQAYARVEEALAKIRREESAVQLGREGLRLAELRFREGVGRQAETLDADLALTQAKTGLVQALRDYAVAWAALERAAGRRWVTDTTVDPPTIEAATP